MQLVNHKNLKNRQTQCKWKIGKNFIIIFNNFLLYLTYMLYMIEIWKLLLERIELQVALKYNVQDVPILIPQILGLGSSIKKWKFVKLKVVVWIFHLYTIFLKFCRQGIFSVIHKLNKFQENCRSSYWDKLNQIIHF